MKLSLKHVKIALYVALFLVASVLFFKWQMVNAPAPQPEASTAQSQAVGSSADAASSNVPNLPVSTGDSGSSKAHLLLGTPPASTLSNNVITVDTPVMKVAISPIGGKIVSLYLTHYNANLKSDQPFQLLAQNQNALHYVVESGLVSSDPAMPKNMVFKSAQTHYTLDDEGQLSVNLTWQGSQGLEITKTFTFLPNAYTVSVNYTIHNTGKAAWSGRFYGELTRNKVEEKSSLLNSYTNYTGAAISYPDDHYQKVKFSEMEDSAISQTVKSGWVAMLQHYFITAFVPPKGVDITQFSAVNNGLYSIGLALPTVTVAPGASETTGATLYAGPAISSELNAIAPYLGKTVDYGWLWFISDLIFAVMKWIHAFVGNWGVAIILVTCLIKLIFYPLSAKSYLSMAKMRALQPKIKALREKVGSDRQKLGMATMELYRKEKVSPLGGCLPIMIQIPVFIALYWVLMESVELRQAPFFGWIHDLSVHDPLYILPVLMGLSMFVQQRLNPAPPDPMQAKIMMFLPVVFTVMFLSFPAGLVLYWLVNNCLSILQQWWVMSRYQKRTKKH